MKQTLVRLFIAGLLVIGMVLAVTRPPLSYYPAVVIDANDPVAGTFGLRFLFDGRSSLQECERLTGNIVRVTLKGCPHCRVRVLKCETTLAEADRTLFTSEALPVPSGRMANGVVTYQTENPELALAACQATEAQSQNTKNPVICHPAETLRTKPAGPTLINPWAAVVLLVAFAAAWLTGWLIIRYEHLHAHLSHDHVDTGPQKYHTEPTPRIGGLAVMVGLLSAGGVMLFIDAITVERLYGLLLLASIPAFLGGLVEDVTKKVGVLERLLLTMLAGVVGAWLLGAMLTRLDIPGVDRALLWLPLAIAATAFAVGGIANAVNIIDGYHGLAGGFAVIVLAAMAYVANSVGDQLVFVASVALIGALLGFLVWNWPDGDVFLGDGGAYLLGFLLAELSVLLVARNPAVSPWFPLLLLIYPVFETIFSIYRRKIKQGSSPGAPDNKHLHQLIHDKLVSCETGSARIFGRTDTNSRVAKYLWVPSIIIAAFGGVFSESTGALAGLALAACVSYVGAYRWIARAKAVPRTLPP